MRLFQDITLGQYLPGDSHLHSLDPRTKKIVLVMMILAVFSTAHLPVLTAMAILILFTIRLAALPFLFTLRGVALFFWLFAFTAIFHLFFTEGDSLYPFPFYGLNMTRQGLEKGCVVFIQLFSVIILANLFTLTTSPREITQGADRLLRPLRRFGVRTEEIALIISLAIRFVPIFRDEALKIYQAQRARGVKFASGNVVQRAGRVVALMGPLFAHILIRTDHLALAMETRGFGLNRERGEYRKLAFRKRDFCTLGMAGLFSLFIFLMY